MKVVFCGPEMTIGNNNDKATEFFKYCQDELGKYLSSVTYIYTDFSLKSFISLNDGTNTILAFFVNKDEDYTEDMLKLFELCKNETSIIWPVAMQVETRMPPMLIGTYQSFDVPSLIENRNLVDEHYKTIAFVLARKLISQSLPTLCFDKSLYFISHRRSDGEHIAAKISDKINLLCRSRRCYRDVVEVEVGKEAQEDIESSLRISDALVFLQTPDAKNSDFIKKEICYALLNNIPILWIQIDGADKKDFGIIPADKHSLSYKSSEFYEDSRLEEIANEIERQCFYMIMNSSANVYSSIELLNEVVGKYNFNIDTDSESSLAYYLKYEKPRNRPYEDNTVNQYIQYFGRNPKDEDKNKFKDRINQISTTKGIINSAVIISGSGHLGKIDKNIFEDNYDDYISTLERSIGSKNIKKNKKIIISGAFPDCDEIYKTSLKEALIIYAKEIISRGYVLVFGSHPTFQNIIFEIGNTYAEDSSESIHMFMAEDYKKGYDFSELERYASVFVTNKGRNCEESLSIMRSEMIGKSNSEAIICLGGKIKANKSEQGVDNEIEIAKSAGVSVFVVGSVGGRSSQLANEIRLSGDWSSINNASKDLNEGLLFDLNHRKMARKIMDHIENK